MSSKDEEQQQILQKDLRMWSEQMIREEVKFHVCNNNGTHRGGSNPNFTRVMDSELAVVTQEQDTGISIATFVKTSAQISVVVKIIT